jgi:hypothetical protein
VPFSGSAHWPTKGPLIIGLGGGSGSGKTTIAESIVNAIGPEAVVLIQQDAYYRDQTDLPLEQRAKVNFDHPDSMETELLVHHLAELRQDAASSASVRLHHPCAPETVGGAPPGDHRRIRRNTNRPCARDGLRCASTPIPTCAWRRWGTTSKSGAAPSTRCDHTWRRSVRCISSSWSLEALRRHRHPEGYNLGVER